MTLFQTALKLIQQAHNFIVGRPCGFVYPANPVAMGHAGLNIDPILCPCPFK
jgi:hypothetical protein